MPLVRHKIKRYGWVADTPDQRDHLYAAPVAHLKKLPPKVDRRSLSLRDPIKPNSARHQDGKPI